MSRNAIKYSSSSSIVNCTALRHPLKSSVGLLRCWLLLQRPRRQGTGVSWWRTKCHSINEYMAGNGVETLAGNVDDTINCERHLNLRFQNHQTKPYGAAVLSGMVKVVVEEVWGGEPNINRICDVCRCELRALVKVFVLGEEGVDMLCAVTNRNGGEQSCCVKRNHFLIRA